MKIARLLATLLALSACGDSPNICTDGTALEHEGRAYCVYRASTITEEGFRCPDAFAFEFPFDGFRACSSNGAQPPATLEEFVRTELGLTPQDGGTVTDADTGDTGTSTRDAAIDPNVLRLMRAAAAETEDESALSGFEGQNFCLGNCSMLTGDIRHFCNRDCQLIRNLDLRNFCTGDCNEINDGLLVAYCLGECEAINPGSDVRPLCEADCDSIRRQSLRDFCLGNCSAL